MMSSTVNADMGVTMVTLLSLLSWSALVNKTSAIAVVGKQEWCEMVPLIIVRVSVGLQRSCDAWSDIGGDSC